MKKLIILLPLLLFSFLSYSQYFKIITDQINEGANKIQGTYKTLSDEVW